VWEGTPGLSTSYLDADAPASAAMGFGAMAIAGTGRYRARGTAAIGFGAMAIATRLVATAVYDRSRSRVRVTAIDLPEDAVRAEVSARPLGTSRWLPIRGGSVVVVDGRFSRPVDHYEFVAGGGMQYRIEAFTTTAEETAPAAQTVVRTVPDTLDQVWLKFIMAPSLNRRVSLTGWSDGSRKARNALFSVKGRPDPIVVTDVHSSTGLSVELLTHTMAEARELESALTAGYPAFLHVPTNVPLDSMYVSVGDITWRKWGTRESPRRIYTVPLTEVAAPPLTVVGPGVTWSSLAAAHASWPELVEAFPTWREAVG